MTSSQVGAKQIGFKYEKLKHLSPGSFRRLTGVKPPVFALMLTALRRAEKKRHRHGGRRPTLSLEDRLLMALEYLREYRTYFHIAQSYGVSESTAYKICRFVEDTLVKDKHFALPGQKALVKSDMQYEVIVIDASESPVERPKKDSAVTTRVKRNATPSKAKSLPVQKPKRSSVSR
jgi:hypothetical protein